MTTPTPKPVFRHLFILVLLAAGAVALASCGQLKNEIPLPVSSNTPGPVAPPAASPVVSPVSTETPLPSATWDQGGPIVTPAETVAAPGQPSATPPEVGSQPSASPTPLPDLPATQATASPTPDGPFGPIVGPGHTLVPTQPPLPTLTPPPTSPIGPTQETGPFGPIVGPGHTLVPTEVRPTATPIPPVPPTPGPSPTPGPGLNSALMGIQIHPHIDSRQIDTVIDLTRELGVDWVKFQFNWSLLESSRGRHTELFYMLTSYVKRFHNQGFRVMISVAKAPGWARRPAADGVLHDDAPPDNPQDLANFLSALLNHLGRDFAGQPYVSAIEVWNEANLQREWYGHPLTGAEYMRYFAPAYDAIRAYDPSIVVITAGPAPTGNSHWSADDRQWLRELYSAGLARYGGDVAVGIHPYGWANPPDTRCCLNSGRGWDEYPQFYFLNTIEDYRAIMDLVGHGAASLWVTEFGWATFDGLRGAGGGQPGVPAGLAYYSYLDQAAQASYTVRAFQIAQSLPYMGPMILWNLNFATLDGAVDRGDPMSGYGLLDSYWQPRPVYQYLKQAPKS